MIPYSIRWRLPLTYAGIALLAVLALGAVLLVTLRSYYRQQEMDYLQGNAEAVGSTLALPMSEGAMFDEALQSQVKGFSFLSQSRVRVLGLDGKVLADSGDPRGVRDTVTVTLGVDVGGLSQEFAQTVEDDSEQGRRVTSRIDVAGEDVRLQQRIAIEGGGADLPAGLNTRYGFELNPYAAADGQRSGQMFSQPVHDPLGKLLAYVELSGGPAFGREILKSVALAWAIAGAVAVAVTTVAGWFISRRLTGPLIGLTLATEHMATGDLSARADIGRRDELGSLAKSFNEMAGRVEVTVLALRRFVADAAHQFHTPLTALRTNLDLMVDGKSGDDRRPVVERARAEVNRLEALSSGLLDLSRAETGPVYEDWAPTDLASLVRDVSELYASQAEQAGLSFAVDLPAQPITVRGSESKLGQALGNLLDNAMKFTPEGGAVEVSLRGDQEWATLAVEDSGIGIQGEDLDLLFERFHRGRNASGVPGNGLGLAIVSAIVDGHGGRVSAASASGGTKFSLRLPV